MSTTHPLTPSELERLKHLAAGDRAELTSLRARTSARYRPELERRAAELEQIAAARLAEIDELEHHHAPDAPVSELMPAARPDVPTLTYWHETTPNGGTEHRYLVTMPDGSQPIAGRVWQPRNGRGAASLLEQSREWFAELAPFGTDRAIVHHYL